MFKRFALLIVGLVAYTQAIKIRSGEAEAVSAETCAYNPLRPAIQLGATLLTNGYLDEFVGLTFVCDLEKLPLAYGQGTAADPLFLQNCDSWVSPYTPAGSHVILAPTGNHQYYVQTDFDKIERVE